MVSLTDPSKFQVEAVHGQQTFEALRAPRTPHLNSDAEGPLASMEPRGPCLRHRRRSSEAWSPGSPSLPDYQAVSSWYTHHLGLVPSDVAVFDDGSPAVTFYRLDRGATPADHHTLALAQGVIPSFAHAAFEVIDADAVGMGNTVMREKGWKHAWGIGRHILGSQIFDYWEDPWGSRHEHYCDGDLFTVDQPMGVHAASRGPMAQWGPPMPRELHSPDAYHRLR